MSVGNSLGEIVGVLLGKKEGLSVGLEICPTVGLLVGEGVIGTEGVTSHGSIIPRPVLVQIASSIFSDAAPTAVEGPPIVTSHL